ncbi:MAG TPA: hypothetical protein VLE99_00155 [Candidatus Saccharimonadales bacterium]|nr:hypothetical protein [Candidatus Saccharimonadales bacterium]
MKQPGPTTSLYDDVVSITYDYLGPAADRFVVRQIRNHLQKDPSRLQPKDLRQLIDWIRLAMRLISNDTRTIDQYIADLESLTQSKRSSAHAKKANR